MYTDFAYAYDRLMNDVPYEAWARYYAGLLELYSIRPGARCVECACGTGSLTIPLAKLGFSMTGMDLSAEMLNLAQQKAREQGMLIPFVRQDMRRLAVQRPVDAVLATCDGPNYLTGSDDPPYTMGGGTYSKAVPNAISFGPGTKGPSRVHAFLPEGHGGAHGRDEALPMEKVYNCARIYVAALLTLDQILD